MKFQADKKREKKYGKNCNKIPSFVGKRMPTIGKLLHTLNELEGNNRGIKAVAVPADPRQEAATNPAYCFWFSS